jgi:hypothetical protein
VRSFKRCTDPWRLHFMPDHLLFLFLLLLIPRAVSGTLHMTQNATPVGGNRLWVKENGYGSSAVAG